MIIEATGLKGVKSDLAHLDDVTAELGFVRWQWEYYRATYDLKIEDKSTKADYFLRINTRVETGKLESPYAVLYVEDVYIGKSTFPHGLDYETPIPDNVMRFAQQKLSQLQTSLS
ncbi:YugN-like family protein [Paenibacillus sp. N1-5-1-14]|uniref:YugN-like family protein n=1 Tax=Paenibacillus TaxID=44249 RepID=UPI0021597B00|nr:YugN-like family protein [Paenibacillus radicibacter]MCR8641744.1 YugN-like family protein [Paenibacillus radicibacter]